ncbi:MAG TPA: glutamate ABC transporter substrate-binding protein [Streptosporangiaceae bacterium]
MNARLPLDGRPWLRALPLMLAAAALVLVVAAADAALAKPSAIGVATTAHAGGTMSAASCNPKASSLRPSGPPQVTSGSFMAKIRDRGFLIAGVDQSTYHFGFLNPLDGRIEGFDIDMIRAVAQAIFGNPNKVEYKAISDAQRIPDILSGSVDIVAHTMTITCARLQQVDFSSVYFDAAQRVLVLKNSAAHSLAGLSGQKVCATTGSDSLAVIAAAKAIPVAVPYWTDCLVLLQQGDVAAISTDDSILAGLAAQDPWTKLIGPRLTDEPYGLAISKQHPDFVAFVNAVLEQLRTNGQWSASYAHWIGTPVPAPPAAQYGS